MKGIYKVGLALAMVTAGVSMCGKDEEEHEAGEVLLKVKDTAYLGSQDLRQGILGVKSIDEITKGYDILWAERVFDNQPGIHRIYQLEFPEDADVKDIVEDLLELPEVEYAEPDYKGSVEPQEDEKPAEMTIPISERRKKFIPNDPDYGKQWGLEKIRAPYAWKWRTQGNDIVLAIVDTGVDYNHPDLKENIFRDNAGKVVGYNFVRKNKDPIDGGKHGTHCAGIAAAVGNNGIGGTGVGWHVKIMPVKSLSDFGFGFSEDLADGIVWAADHGAHVISNSWGSPSASRTVREAIRYAQKKGVIVIAAAGNSNTNRRFYPASYPEVIAVGATAQDDERASFSNYGDYVDVSAPGSAIYSTLPLGHYGTFSGTSMAGPFVAGAAALALQENPTLNAAQMEELLKATGDKVDGEIGPRLNLEKLIQEARKRK